MNKRNQKITTYFVILSLLVIGVVYAILQANLQINGIAKIKSNTWDIHFNNIQINNNSVSIGTGDSPATIDPNDTSKVDFSVTLSTPGDFYEFTVDVVNAGTIDGMIELLTQEMKVNNEVVQETPNYLNYIVTYEDDSSILLKHLLEAGETLTYKVRLEFKTDIEELPEAATINSSFGVQFVQADDTAIKKRPYYACTFDGELVQGAEYTNGQYTYRYMQEYGTWNSSSQSYEWANIENDGWGVHLSDPTSTDSVTTKLCTSINDKPIVSMSYMFYGSKTTSVDTTSFNTSNVTNMNNMFYGCSSLTDIDVTKFDTSNVTNMSYMFSGCSNLSSIDVSHLDTSNVTNISSMFENCSNLTSIDLSSFDTSKVTSFVSLFSYSNNILEVNLNNFSFSTVPNALFLGNNSIKKVSCKNWIIPSSFTNGFFRNMCGGSSIEEIDVTGWDLSNTTNISGLFAGSGANGLKRIVGLNTWDTSNITNMSQMFANLSNIESIDLSNFVVKSTTNISVMFLNCSGLKTVDLSGFDFSNFNSNTTHSVIFSGASSLETLIAKNWIIPENFEQALKNKLAVSTSLKEIDVTGWDLSHTTTLKSLFYNYSNLVTITGLNTWNTSNITNTSFMFDECTNLTTELNLSNWNTSNVTDMQQMFRSCQKVPSINVYGWDTSKVTNMYQMFLSCSSIQELDLRSFNVTNANVNDMFYSCSAVVRAFARTQADADKMNSSQGKPSNVNFVVRA